MEGISLNGLIVVRGIKVQENFEIIRWLASKEAFAIELTASTALSQLTNESRWKVIPFCCDNSPEQILASLSDSHTKQLVFFNWVELVALKHGLDSTLAAISKAKDQFCICLHISSHTEQVMKWDRIAAVADSLIDLRHENGRLLARTSRWERSGKLVSEEEIITIQCEPLRIACEKYKPTIASLTEYKNESLETSFDIGLNLKSSEKLAKESLQLPYTKMQTTEGLVGIRMSSGKKTRAGGRVIYTPEEGDDLDDSDPDDDLNL